MDRPKAGLFAAELCETNYFDHSPVSDWGADEGTLGDDVGGITPETRSGTTTGISLEP